jgi:hypothetical protein
MITGDFVNGLHLMVGLSTDNKPDTTSENTFFLEEDSGDVYYFSDGEWNESGSGVAQFISALLGGGSSLPAVDSDDAGKVLTVSEDGVWEPEDAGAASVTAAAVAAAIEDMSTEQAEDSLATLGGVAKPIETTVSGTTVSITASDNVEYTCGELTSLTIAASSTISFVVDFTSGSTPTALYVPSGFKAPGGDLTPQADVDYELNVRNGKCVLTPFEAVSGNV